MDRWKKKFAKLCAVILLFGLIYDVFLLSPWESYHRDFTIIFFNDVWLYMNSGKQNFVPYQDVKDVSAWSLQPKETWDQHFQSIFEMDRIYGVGKEFIRSKCDSHFEQNLYKNLDIIDKYPLNVEDYYLQQLSLDEYGIKILTRPLQNPIEYPVLVTAASSDHYWESIEMVQSYHRNILPLHKNIKMIYYDIGLTNDERRDLEENCKCEVRMFDFAKYPRHVTTLMGYAWKPIIIQTVLTEYDLVMWIDASVRFLGNPLDELSFRARQRGIQGMSRGTGTICRRTSKKTFEFLQENPCLFSYSEFEATWLVVSRNEFTLKYIMKPWVSCALLYSCMVYESSHLDLYCYGIETSCHSCHHFDQSVLGIILTRIFHEHRHSFRYDYDKILYIRRHMFSPLIYNYIWLTLMGVEFILAIYFARWFFCIFCTRARFSRIMLY